MPKLNQIIAIEKGIKSRVVGEIDVFDKAAQKPQLFNGFSKQYESKDADGETLPPEQQRVQFNVPDVLRAVARLTTELMDVVARKDWTNCHAHADVVIDGTVIIPKVPVTTLLFLEKQLNDIHTLYSRLPVLDEADDWKLDKNEQYRTEPVSSHRTKKVQKPLVLVAPTDKHPGQAVVITEDVIVGFWKATKVSGAIPRPHRLALLRRVEALQVAVKEAREAANNIDEVKDIPALGDAIFNYILAEKEESENSSLA